MARGLNKVMIIGFVGRDLEMRRTSQGQPVTSFNVSTSRRWTTNSGDAHESTEWFRVVAWGDMAETAQRQIRKDQRVYVEGHLQTRSWEDTDGQRHARTEVVASRLLPMDSREAIASREAAGESEDTDSCLNRVMVIGNLGRDPEMRYTPEGHAVTSFSLAATRNWHSTTSGRHDSTEWFNIVAWGSLAEICSQYLTKGRRVYIEGELRTRGWDQADGGKHFRTELVAEEMIMLGPRPKQRFSEQELGVSDKRPPF